MTRRRATATIAMRRARRFGPVPFVRSLNQHRLQAGGRVRLRDRVNRRNQRVVELLTGERHAYTWNG